MGGEAANSIARGAVRQTHWHCKWGRIGILTSDSGVWTWLLPLPDHERDFVLRVRCPEISLDS